MTDLEAAYAIRGAAALGQVVLLVGAVLNWEEGKRGKALAFFLTAVILIALG